MSEILEILSIDRPADSREDINANFEALNTGKVDGAENLTTPGSIPYVNMAGAVQQDTDLCWVQATHRLGIGTTTPSAKVEVIGDGSENVFFARSTGYTNFAGFALDSSVFSGDLGIRLWGVTGAIQYMGSGALLTWRNVVGLDTAGSFDVGIGRNAAGVLEVNSGVAGTLRDVLLRHTNLAGSLTDSSGDNAFSLSAASAGQVFRSDNLIRWSNSASTWNATQDTAIGRASAGVLEVNSGVAGTKRDISVRNVLTTLTTPASAAAAGVAGAIVADANFIYVCVATDTWKRVAIATW